MTVLPFRPRAGFTHLVAILSILHSGPLEDPRKIVRAATRAVEGDSAAALGARWTARLKDDSTDTAALLGLATIARLSYRYDDAIRLYSRLLARPGGQRDRSTAWARLGLAISARGRGDNARADSLFAQAGLDARDPADPAAQVEALLGRATTQMRIVGPIAALSFTDQSRKFIPATDPQLLAEWHCMRALLLGAANRPEAGPEATTGADLAGQGGDPNLQATCLAIKARDLARQGAVDSAVALAARVLAQYARVHSRGDLAAVSQWRGYMLTGLGLYGEARRDFETSVREGRASENQSAVAWSLLNLSIIALLEGDGTAARTTATEAESLFASQGDDWGLASLRGHQGAIAQTLGDTAAAKAAFQDALARFSRFSPDGAIENLQHLAVLALKDRDWGTAEHELDQARAIVREHQMHGWDQSLEYYYGTFALERGDLLTAERSLQRDLGTLHSNQESQRYSAETKLAEVYARQGRLDRAEAMLLGATDSLEAWRASLDDPTLRLHVFDLREDDLDPNRSVEAVIGALAASGRGGPAFELAERRRARELLDRMVRLDVLRGGSSGLDSSIGTMRSSPARPSAEQVSSTLPDERTALLEYVGGAPHLATTLFVITRAGLRSYPLPGIDSLDRQVERFVALLQSDAPVSELAKRLGSFLLGAAVADLPPTIERLVIVPDGVLHRLPFEALMLGDGRVVLERFAVTLAPSATIALNLWRRPADHRPVTLLAFGDPKFEREAEPGSDARVYRSAFDENGGLTRLASSADEARSVARYAPRAEVRLREGASEAFLKQADLGAYRVLHFATHALVDERTAARTALALAPGGGEDGFVGPADLAGLNLDADLVVLSACRTAGGVLIGGEGIQGLTAPLLQAGARAVVATEWPIGDRGTRELVEGLYRGLADGLTAGDALRAAKLAAMRRGDPASQWAAFTLIGDPMIRIPLRRPRLLQWWWIGVGVLFAAVLYGTFRWNKPRPVLEV